MRGAGGVSNVRKKQNSGLIQGGKAMRTASKICTDFAARKMLIEKWKSNVTENQVKAQDVFAQLVEQTATLLDKRAEAWIGENKLIHAGAAQKLAADLRKKAS